MELIAGRKDRDADWSRPGLNGVQQPIQTVCGGLGSQADLEHNSAVKKIKGSIFCVYAESKNDQHFLSKTVVIYKCMKKAREKKSAVFL